VRHDHSGDVRPDGTQGGLDLLLGDGVQRARGLCVGHMCVCACMCGCAYLCVCVYMWPTCGLCVHACVWPACSCARVCVRVMLEA